MTEKGNEMKNTFGNSIKLTLFGESHGAAIGAVLDGLAAGVKIGTESIAAALARRRPSGALDTSRREPDEFSIVSGVFEGRTTGTPLCIIIPNKDTRSGDYNEGIARPSHADFAANAKYHGFEDYRGGGHFSGRVTAALVACGAILSDMLGEKNIKIGTHILRCGKVADREFEDTESDIDALRRSTFPTLGEGAEEAVSAEILAAKADCDSVGGATQTAICGLCAGVGEPWFDSLEGMLSHAIFSIGGIKGIEFGSGFDGCLGRGSEFNDSFEIKGDKVTTSTNHNGGINGGISNGMPIIFNCAVKPTPSISRPQQTVNFKTGENVTLEIKGRHDPAIIRRICPVIDALTALVVADMLACRYGTEFFAEERK